jgi:hypothetical protein
VNKLDPNVYIVASVFKITTVSSVLVVSVFGTISVACEVDVESLKEVDVPA